MSDTSGSGFAPFMPGLELFQALAGQVAGGMAPAGAATSPQIPNLSHWVAPTFNVEELDKRIQELKAVHFWLDQNSKALAASIQALEVQKMTLTTLRNMNVSLGEVADALKMPNLGEVAAPAAAPPASKPTAFAGLEIPPRTYGAAPQPEPEPATPPAPEEGPAPDAPPPESAGSAPVAPSAAAAAAVDPMQWWGALAQQFQQIASQALQSAAAASAATPTPAAPSPASAPLPRRAARAPAGAPPASARKPKAAAKTARAAAAPAARKTRAAKAPPPPRPSPAAPRAQARAAASPVQPLSPGNWALPHALFPLAGLQAAAEVPAPAAPKRRSAASGKGAPTARAPSARKR